MSTFAGRCTHLSHCTTFVHPCLNLTTTKLSDSTMLQSYATISSSTCRYCAATMHHLIHQDNDGTDFTRWLKDFHIPLCYHLLLSKASAGMTFLWNGQDISGFAPIFTSYGLQSQDVEWFSRAAMVKGVLQVCCFICQCCLVTALCWLNDSIAQWLPHLG